MLEINKGRVRIMSWCDSPESGAIDQAVAVANLDPVFHHVAIMPDTHVGVGCPIGSVVAMKDHVCPSMVGSDAGCGMIAARTDMKSDRLGGRETEIIGSIRRNIPMGFSRQPDDRMIKKAKTIVESIYEIE